MAVEDNAGNLMADTLGGLFSGTIFVVVTISAVVLIFGLVLGLIYYFLIYKKKFDITTKIISKRSGENRIYFDKAAIIKDKKNKKDYLRLFNTNVELELPKFDIFTHTNKGDYLELIRISEKSFRFLTAPRIEENFIIKHDGKRYPMSTIKHYQIENDISWLIDRLKTNKRLIDPESLLLKLLAFAPQVISMAISLMAVIFVMKYMPDFFDKMASAIKALESKQTVEVVGSLLPLGFLRWKKK